jgi:hypothetical protein
MTAAQPDLLVESIALSVLSNKDSAVRLLHISQGDPQQDRWIFSPNGITCIAEMPSQ